MCLYLATANLTYYGYLVFCAHLCVLKAVLWLRWFTKWFYWLLCFLPTLSLPNPLIRVQLNLFRSAPSRRHFRKLARIKTRLSEYAVGRILVWVSYKLSIANLSQKPSLYIKEKWQPGVFPQCILFKFLLQTDTFLQLNKHINSTLLFAPKFHKLK